MLSCCLILLHTYIQTDGLYSSSFLLLWTGWIGRGRRRRRREKKDGGGLYIYQAGFYWGMLVHLLLTCYFRGREEERGKESGDSPQLQSKKKKKIRTDKNPLFLLSHPRNQQISPASATINAEAVLVAKNISKNSKPNTGRANKSAWELLRKFKLLRDKS